MTTSIKTVMPSKYTDNRANNLPILTPLYEDHTLNETSYILSNNSFYLGDSYKLVYQHLLSDIEGKELQSESISGITIQFYLADDGHKICPVSEIANLEALFSNTGTAYYFVVDIENGQFKLPRKTFQDMKLYFYIGQYDMRAIEQAAGINSETLSRKADINSVVDLETSQTVIGNKSFTGTLTATTQNIDDNSTNVATTAFVKGNIKLVTSLPATQVTGVLYCIPE